MQLLGDGGSLGPSPQAVAFWGPWALGPSPLLWRWKQFLDQRFRRFHVPGQVAESHLGLDHPKLRRVSGGIGILRAEGGAEGVNVREGAGKGFAFQLPAHGEVGALPEEVPGFRFLRTEGRPFQGGDSEHLAGALAIRRGDDGSMDMDKATLLKKAVNRIGEPTPDPEHRAEEIGPGAEVRDFPEEFPGMTLLLERVRFVGRSHDGDGLGLQLPGLTLALGRHDQADDVHGGTGVEQGNVVAIPFQGCIVNHLEAGQTRAVVHLEEGECLRLPSGADPTLHAHLSWRRSRRENLLDPCPLHRAPVVADP